MPQYVIHKDRATFIHNNFFEFSFNEESNDEIEPDRQKFEQLVHPAELHYLASIYNWDDGNTVPLWIVESPLCSKATAILVFWLTTPDYYRQYVR